MAENLQPTRIEAGESNHLFNRDAYYELKFLPTVLPKNNLGDLEMGMTDEDRRRLKGSGGGTEPLAAPINEASRLSGLSRSELYRRLAAGDIQAVKSGSRTLILMASLRAHLASLPPATFRAPRKAA